MSVHVRPLTSSPQSSILGPAAGVDMIEEFPGVATSLDPDRMQTRLQDALLGRGNGWKITSCRPGQATYIPGDRFLVRYRLELTEGRTNLSDVAHLNARVFKTGYAADRHFRRLLEPLARLSRGHAALRIFARPAAVLEDLGMSVAAFPIDAALPTLPEASDGRVVVDLLSRALGRQVNRCEVHLGHYGRQHRCVLRYEVETDTAGQGRERKTVWGKVASDTRGTVALDALEALQEPARHGGFLVPRPLGYTAGLRLLLLEDMVGVPVIGPLLKARLRGEATTLEPGLEASLRATATLLVGLHESGFAKGALRDSRSEIETLAWRSSQVGEVSPALGSTLERALERAWTMLEGTEPLKATFAHGDFSHTQILFDGAVPGVVDFDTVCRAEPALDIGHFLAYLRLASVKAAPDPLQGKAVADELGEVFVSAYAAARNLSSEDHLRERIAAYEIVSLVRLAVHSWQKLKTTRLDRVMTLLKE